MTMLTCELYRHRSPMKVYKRIGKFGSRNPNIGSPATPHLQVVKGSRDLLLKIWYLLHISETVGARNVKFSRQIHHLGYNAKLGQRRSEGDRKGVMWSCGLLLKFWDPLHISGTVGAKNAKFGRQIDHRER